MKTFPNSPGLLDRVAIQLSSHLTPKDLKVLGWLAVLAIAIIVFQEFGAQYAITRAYILRTVNFGILSVVVLAGVTGAILLILLFLEGIAYAIEFFTRLLRHSSRPKVIPFPMAVQMSRSIRLHRIMLVAFCGVAGLAAGANVLLTAYASYRFDQPLMQSRAEFYNGHGCFELHVQQGKNLTYCKKPDDGFSVRLGMNGNVPVNARRAIETIEDRGAGSRLFSGNMKGMLRGLRDLLSPSDGGIRQGGSSYKEQLAGQLLGLKPRFQRGFVNQVGVKFEKTLAGIRLGDVYDDEELLRMYADRITFGALRGYEIQGYRAASVLYFGKEPEELTLSESFGLAAIIQNPNSRFPHARQNEDASSANRRKQAQRNRLTEILGSAVKDNLISGADAEETLNSLYTSLRPLPDIARDISIPRKSIVLKELIMRVPDASARSLVVESAIDSGAQEILENAVNQTRTQVERRLYQWERELLVIDAVVLNAAGDHIAEVGQTRLRGDGCSIYKALLYERALDLGIIGSMETEILPGISARQALAQSINEGAEELINRMGPAEFKTWLERNGFSVACACTKIALGAGVDGSPSEVGMAFHQFGYQDPGNRVVNSGVITSIRDAASNQILFARNVTPSVRPAIGIAVRKALENTALTGTGKELNSLARISPIAAKTGTSAFFRDGKWLGGGGSWTVALDSRTGVTVVVRMRLQNQRPFRPEGGHSAVFVVRDFIAAWRQRSNQ